MRSKSEAPRAGRLRFIDAMRGIAAMAVLVQHAVEIDFERSASGIVASAEAALLWSINLGRFGVVLFFLISGFVIPLSIGGPRPLARFAVNRVLRLYPLYWMSIAAAVWLGQTVLSHTYSSAQIAANATMVQRLLGQPDIRTAYWTLFIELVFYGACVVLFAAGRLGSWRVLAALSSAGALLTATTILLRHGAGVPIPSPDEPFFLAMMFAGALARLAFEGAGSAATRTCVAVFLLLGAAGLVQSGLLVPVSANRNAYLGAPAVATANLAALALFAVALAARRPAWGWLAALGTISYSVYLNQAVILTLLTHIPNPLGGAAGSLLFLSGCSILTICLSVATYGLVERPFISLGRRITGAMKNADPGWRTGARQVARERAVPSP